jgi:hypothetical protein
VTGSGFFVGSSVVVTATHVLRGCRTARVLVKGKRWVSVTRSINWLDRGNALDVSTLKLAEPVTDVWLFAFRRSQIPRGASVAAIGHPLGEGLSYTNGHVLGRIPRQMLVLRILSAQGMSGGPVVDSHGAVVGVINGLLSERPGLLTGGYTADNLIAYDISSRWGAWRRTLCQTYRFGGIDDCPNSSVTPPSSAPPSTASPPSTTPPPTAPPPPPPPPAWTPPPGFTLWTGSGIYRPGSLAFQYATTCTRIYSLSATCWGVNIISEFGCPDGAFVKVNIYDAYGTLVDNGIDQIAFLPANQIGFAHGDTFQATAANFQITGIDCFDY